MEKSRSSKFLENKLPHFSFCHLVAFASLSAGFSISKLLEQALQEEAFPSFTEPVPSSYSVFPGSEQIVPACWSSISVKIFLSFQHAESIQTFSRVPCKVPAWKCPDLSGGFVFSSVSKQPCVHSACWTLALAPVPGVPACTATDEWTLHSLSLSGF